MENLSLQQLLEIENQTTVLSFSDFVRGCKRELAISCFLYSLTAGKCLWNPFFKLYIKYRRNSPIYQAIDELYNHLLDDLIEVISDTTIEKDPLSLSILIGDYLIPLGVLSYSTKFHHTNSSKLLSTDAHYWFHDGGGKYICCGYGCCRHIVSLTSDIFHKMGITNDKITCFFLDAETVLPSFVEDVNADHLILGYIWNGRYYLGDITNHIYALSVGEEYVEAGHKKKYVLDYDLSNYLQGFLNWSFDMEYGSFSKEEVMMCRKNVKTCFFHSDIEKFREFKRAHMDIYEKLSWLLPIEMGRSAEREQQKQKQKLRL